MAILLSICGYPGFGKSTQCERLKNFYGEKAVVLCVPKLLNLDAESISVLSQDEIQIIRRNIDRANNQMHDGVLVDSFIDRLLYNVADRFLDFNDIVILDGSPRDMISLNFFLNLTERRLQDKSIVVYLTIGQNEVEFSIRRQIERAKRNQTYNADICQFRNKSATFNILAKHKLADLFARQCCNVEYHEICCEDKETVIFERIVGIIQYVSENSQ